MRKFSSDWIIMKKSQEGKILKEPGMYGVLATGVNWLRNIIIKRSK